MWDTAKYGKFKYKKCKNKSNSFETTLSILMTILVDNTNK